MAVGSPIAITLVNDYEIVVEGLRRMLDPYRDVVRVVETEAGGLPDHPTDIALFDTFAGRRRSLARIEDMAADRGIAKLVLYTWDLPASYLVDIDARDLDGVIMKSETGQSLVESLVRIHRGERLRPEVAESVDGIATLTEREREVLALIAQGATNPAIAEELYLSADTIKTHVRKLFAKLGVSNRTQAALLAVEHQLTPPVLVRGLG